MTHLRKTAPIAALLSTMALAIPASAQVSIYEIPKGTSVQAIKATNSDLKERASQDGRVLFTLATKRIAALAAIPGPGTLKIKITQTVSGETLTIASVTRKFTKAGSYIVKVPLTAAGVAAFRDARRKGTDVNANITSTFDPTNGAAQTVKDKLNVNN